MYSELPHLEANTLGDLPVTLIATSYPVPASYGRTLLSSPTAHVPAGLACTDTDPRTSARSLPQIVYERFPFSFDESPVSAQVLYVNAAYIRWPNRCHLDRLQSALVWS